MPVLGALFLLFVCLVQLQCDRFCFILYFICYVWLSLLKSLFSSRDKKGVVPDGKRGGEELGVWGEETVIRMCRMKKKESIFHKSEKFF